PLYSACVFVLSLSCSCAHLLLPSFPTRRSSDLQVRVGRLPDQPGAAGGGPVLRAPQRLPPLAEHQGPAHPAGVGAGQVRDDPAEDRKSTRLNSSHVSISYAVFCLKKKTSARRTH